jgi:hypothetical protein
MIGDRPNAHAWSCVLAGGPVPRGGSARACSGQTDEARSPFTHAWLTMTRGGPTLSTFFKSPKAPSHRSWPSSGHWARRCFPTRVCRSDPLIEERFETHPPWSAAPAIRYCPRPLAETRPVKRSYLGTVDDLRIVQELSKQKFFCFCLSYVSTSA